MIVRRPRLGRPVKVNLAMVDVYKFYFLLSGNFKVIIRLVYNQLYIVNLEIIALRF